MSEKRRSPTNRKAQIRSETLGVRLDPKTRYLVDIAARVQRRSTSSFVEWALIEALKKVQISDGGPLGPEAAETVADASASLWDVLEADRFINLAWSHPELLTYDEQVLLHLLKDNGRYWRTGRDSYRREEHAHRENLIREHVVEDWDELKAAAKAAV